MTREDNTAIMWLSRAIKGLFLFLGLTAVGVVAAINFVDWNQYRTTLQSLLQQQLGVDVAIEGDVGLALDPLPTLTASDISLTHPSTLQTIATAEEFGVRVDIQALLKGQVAFERAEAIGLSMTLSQLPQGGWIVENWPLIDPSAVTTRSADVSFGLLALRESSIGLEFSDGTVREVGITGVDLRGRVPAGPLQAVGQISLLGDDFALDARLRPLRRREGDSFRLVLDGAQTQFKMSGRQEEGGGISLRVESSGDDLARVLRYIKPSYGSQNQHDAVPFALDLSVQGTAPVLETTIRQAKLGRSQARFTGEVIEAAEGELLLSGALAISHMDIPELSIVTDMLERWHALIVELPQDAEPPLMPALDMHITVETAALSASQPEAQAQQIVSHIRSGSDGLAVEAFSALLPGATQIRMNGRTEGQTLDGFKAKVELDTSRLNAFARAFDVTALEALEAGRLATLSAGAELTIDSSGWSLREIEGLLDTTIFTGRAAGLWSDPLPRMILLNADALNIDAYWPSQPMQGSGDQEAGSCIAGICLSSFAGSDLSVSVNLEQMRWRGQLYEQLVIAADMSDDVITLDTVRMKRGDGSLNASGTLRGVSTAPELALMVSLDSWDYALVPDASVLDSLLQGRSWSGTLELNGEYLSPRIIAQLDSSKNDAFNLTGQIFLQDGRPGLSAQGSIVHSNIAPLMELSGIRTLRAVDADVSGSFDWRPRRGLIDLAIAGRLGGARGQVQAARGARNALTGTLTFDHNVANAFQKSLFLPLFFPYPDTGVTGSVAFTVEPDGLWALTSFELINGQAAFEGSLAAATHGTLTGDLRVRGLELGSVLTDGGVPLDFQRYFTNTDRSFKVADLTLGLQDSVIFGQRVSSLRARVIEDSNRFEASLLDGAMLNDGTATGSLTVDLISGDAQFSGQLARVDIAGALSSAGVPAGLEGYGQIATQLETRLQRGQDFLEGLNGRLQFRSDDVALHFVSLPEVVKLVAEAPTIPDYISGFAAALRGGRSPAMTLAVDLAFETGTVLLQQFSASSGLGRLDLDGQINLPNDRMAIGGQLVMTQPLNLPPIPLRYEGSVRGPSARFDTAVFDRAVTQEVVSRLRRKLFAEQNTAAPSMPLSPGGRLFKGAENLLQALKAKQAARDLQPIAGQAKEPEEDGP